MEICGSINKLLKIALKFRDIGQYDYIGLLLFDLDLTLTLAFKIGQPLEKVL